MQKEKTIVIVGGATGGHLFPALALAQELKERHHCRIVIVINPRAEKLKQNLPPDDFVYVNAPSIKNKFNLFELASAVRRACEMCDHYSPAAIVGFGSSLTFPVLLAGWLKRVPNFLHEQNAVFGLANNVSRYFCKKVALSFPVKGVKENQKYAVVGNLLRRDIVTHLSQTRAYAERSGRDKLTLLVVGGSQGAHFINKVVAQALQMMNKESLQKIVLYHVIGGRDNCEAFKDIYQRLSLEFFLWSFHADIGQIYKMADFVISRAGAGAVTENISFGMPSLFIPYPFANAHQLYNARYVSDKGGGITVEQNNMTPELCKSIIESMLEDYPKRLRMHKATLSLAKPAATERFAQSIINTIR